MRERQTETESRRERGKRERAERLALGAGGPGGGGDKGGAGDGVGGGGGREVRVSRNPAGGKARAVKMFADVSWERLWFYRSPDGGMSLIGWEADEWLRVRWGCGRAHWRPFVGLF